MNENKKGDRKVKTPRDTGVGLSDLLDGLSSLTNDWEKVIEKVGDIGIEGNINAAIIIPMQRMVMDIRKLIINHSS